jgi:PadR family transcriptional regulator, regulatory protein PadR
MKRNPVVREILLAFWKVHILHHAQARPIYGQWLLEELRRHGLRVSPGTLYPLLARMEQHGWLQVTKAPLAAVANRRREYVLTPKGARTLAGLRKQVEELYREVVEEARSTRSRHSKR